MNRTASLNRTASFSEFFDIPSHELAFIPSDGMSESVLSASSGFFHDNSGTARLLGELRLGTLTTICNATDLNGDGEIDNRDIVEAAVYGCDGIFVLNIQHCILETHSKGTEAL